MGFANRVAIDTARLIRAHPEGVGTSSRKRAKEISGGNVRHSAAHAERGPAAQENTCARRSVFCQLSALATPPRHARLFSWGGEACQAAEGQTERGGEEERFRHGIVLAPVDVLAPGGRT